MAMKGETGACSSALPQRQYGLPFPSDPPPEPGLAAEEQTIETMLSSEYWRRICPQLTVDGVGGGATQSPPSPLTISDEDMQVLHKLLDDEGYFTLPPHCMSWAPGLMEKLALGVVQLMQCGWSPAFICMFDEAWWVCNAVDEMMQKVTGGNRNNMDFLAWYIDPGAPVSDGGRGPAAGFAPHRDRQPRDIPASFRAGGEAKYLTCWLPFTDATPENSCLYLIPKSCDPSYFAGDEIEDAEADPMSAAIEAAPRGFQDIRALPVQAGGAVFFTHRVIHWGSASRAGYPTPRIACSWAATADDYEKPYFSREHLPLPPSALRASLCAGQQLNYYKRFRPSKYQLDLYNRVFNASASEFDPHYKTKVQGEYQWAKFEMAREKTPAHRKQRKRDEGESNTAPTAAEQECFCEVAAPLDLEEELQGLFGGGSVGHEAVEEEHDDDDFEDSYWNGSEWVDGPPPARQ